MDDVKNTVDMRKPARKTREQDAEDVAYTINHAFACMTSDIAIAPYVGNWTQKYLGKRVNIGCDHGPDEHTHADGTVHGAHAHGAFKQESHFWHYFKGEFIGDFGAVPITVALVRHAPAFMGAVGKVIEPVLGPIFRHGARRSAQIWATEQMEIPDAAAIKAKEEELYKYEVEHLPQAAVWTATSVVMNVAAQKWLLGNKGKWSHITAGKITGTAISAAAVVGARALAPEKAHKWDNFAARSVFAPATRATSRLFGVRDDAVERIEEKNGDYNVKGGFADQARKAQIEAHRAAAAAR